MAKCFLFVRFVGVDVFYKLMLFCHLNFRLQLLFYWQSILDTTIWLFCHYQKTIGIPSFPNLFIWNLIWELKPVLFYWDSLLMTKLIMEDGSIYFTHRHGLYFPFIKKTKTVHVWLTIYSSFIYILILSKCNKVICLLMEFVTALQT